MASYILRFAGTNDLAGFYSAKNESALMMLIDEEHNTADYDYAILRDGFGIEFRKGTKYVDLELGGDVDATEVLAQASYVYLTSELQWALGGDGYKELEWHRLDVDP